MTNFKKFSKQVQQGKINTISVTTDIGTNTFTFDSISSLAKQGIQRSDGNFTVGALFSHPVFHSASFIEPETKV